ncbi:hypothetical protein [Spirosoma aerolatum]|uniref:hypothetical protein n=1 Tax=Spirosoma aerolatum TaxID=1211326 RepID=UPI0009AD29E2|nr:hypothetical protein [Spirosoma aerolatum]
MKLATLSRKEVKTRLQVSDYIFKRLLLDSNSTDVLQRPDQRIFPVSAWVKLFEHCGVPLTEAKH